MIKSLLFFCALLLAISGYAQKNVLVSDTTYFSRDSGRTFNIYNIDNYNYNLLCQDTLHVYGNLNTVAMPFYNSDSITYNSDGTVHVLISSHLDTATNIYTHDTRITNSYLTDKLLDSSLRELLNNGIWQKDILTVNTYDAMRNVINSENKMWDETLQAYIHFTRDVYTYSTTGKPTSHYYEKWDVQSTTWVPYITTLYSYDSADHLIGGSYTSGDDFTGLFFDSSTYYIGPSGLTDSSVNINSFTHFGVTNTYLSKIQYTYYEFTKKIKQVTLYTFKFGTISGIQRDTHYYDTVSNFYIDSLVTNGLSLTTQQDSLLLSTRIDKNSYNIDSTIAESISIYRSGQYLLSNQYSRTIYHYASCQSILPVTLLSFTGELKNTDALLHWAATNEGNVMHYIVQRSTDGVHFTTIGNVMPVGRDAYQNKYNYIDKNISLLQSPKVFYRLVQTDKNGIITYTKIVTLYVSTNKLLITLSPNPVQNMLAVYSPVAIAGATIVVADINGRQFYTSSQNLGAGSRLMIDMSAYPKGMYLVTVQSGNDRHRFKVVK